MKDLDDVLFHIQKVFDCILECPNCETCKKLVHIARECIKAYQDQ